jgi:hypothetical protein
MGQAIVLFASRGSSKISEMSIWVDRLTADGNAPSAAVGTYLFFASAQKGMICTQDERPFGMTVLRWFGCP